MKAAHRDRRSQRRCLCAKYASGQPVGRARVCGIAAVGLAVAAWAINVQSQEPGPRLAPPQQGSPQQVPPARPAPQQDVPAENRPLPRLVPQAPLPGFQQLPRRDNSAGERPTLFATDRTAARRLKLAEARLEKGVYEEAVDLLQTILDSEEDAAAPADSETPVFRSLKRQAIDLLTKLPPDGRRIYELKYGVAARGKLEDAMKQGDWAGVEAVSRRYFHTAAGREATYRRAVWADDRGESLEAALLFQRLLDDDTSSFEPQLSLRTATAWSKAGIDDLARKAAERYLTLPAGKANAVPDAVADVKSPDELLAWIKRTTDKGSTDDAAWPTFGGSADRLSDVDPVAIAEGAAWSHRLHEPTEWDSARDAAHAARLSIGLDILTKAANSTGDLTQPAFHPVVAQNTVMFRTLRNIQAVDLATGKLLWQTESPHDQYFDAAVKDLELLIRYIHDDFGGASELGGAVGQFAWQNLTSGMLSTDGRFVYGIEGTGRAGTSRLIVQGVGRPMVVGESDFNSLVAYELAAEGRIAWTAGGPPAEDAAAGLFFLGPPLPLGGRLYALAERDGSIQLLAMDPLADAAGRVVWSQTLVESDQPLSANPLRRISGLSPTFSDGVLVCPTGAGAVVGVDLARRVLLWGYEYADRSGSGLQPGGEMFFGNPHMLASRTRWLDGVPHIADGAVFLTPLDSDEMHCVDLTTGQVRWKHSRRSLLYLATVHDGKAIVVGRRSLLALDVATGKTVWERPLDETPSGRGVRSGDLYHVPLMSGEVATIRLSNHQELVRSPAGSGIVPGNLIAVQGRLLSLSTDAIVGFHRSADVEAAQRDAAAADDAITADELALRAAQALHRGDVDEGLTLLRRAATAGASASIKRSYVHFLLEGLRADFSRYRQYQQDALAIAEDPKQKAELFRLLADGFEAAGETPAAFEALLGLAASDVAEPGYSIVDGERLVRSDRIYRIHVEQLLASASPADRAAMEAFALEFVQRSAERRDAVALERFCAIIDEPRLKQPALDVLATLYSESGASKELERVRLRLGVADTATPTDAATVAGDFDVGFRAEYVPGEIKAGRKTSGAELDIAVPVVGPVPSTHAGWQFALDEKLQTLVARDRIGRERWRVSLTEGTQHFADDPFGNRNASPGRAQVRFSGHLLAVVAGTRLCVLDLLTHAEVPPVLWQAELAGRIYSTTFINRRVMNVPTDGPIGFAGSEILLYEAGDALNAVEPLTGDILWRRIGISDDCELSGDDEFVTLQFPSGGEVLVLDARDGRVVTQKVLPEMLKRLAWRGTNIVTTRPTEAGLEVTSDDIARGENRWSRRFSPAALTTSVGSDEIAILEPTEGRLLLLNCSDGSIVFETKTEADPSVTEIAVTRRFGRVVLFTTRRELAGLVTVRTDSTREAVDGLAYGFDEQGTRIWSAAVQRQFVDLHQPPGLPVLLLTAKRVPLNGEASHSATVLDVRNGQTLFEKRRISEYQPVAVDADVTSRSISIECQGARILLTPSGQPLPAAKAESLADLAGVDQKVRLSRP